MAERRGKILTYNATNRQGTIKPEDNGPTALFYINSVSNPEPEPKAKDVVVFTAPEPRKNKRGKMVQDQASSVTIEERAPELTPEQIAAREKKKNRERAELRRTFLEARKSGGIKKPERKGRRSDKGKGRSRNPRDKDGERPKRPRNPRSSEERSSERRARKPLKSKKVDPRQKKPSIQSKIRYPMARDIPRSILHMDQSNPGLVFDKFLQWPGATDAATRPKRHAPQKKAAGKNQTVEKTQTPPAAGLENTAQVAETSSAPVAPITAEATPKAVAPDATAVAKAPIAADAAVAADSAQKDGKDAHQSAQQEQGAPQQTQQWKLTGKHKQFFLTKTLAPLYRNFERKTLPWAAVRARREVMLRSLENSGYAVASDVIKGPWRFAISNTLPSILDEAPLSFQRIFSYPVIPAKNLQQLLLRHIEQCDTTSLGLSEEVAESFRKSIDRQTPEIIVFDAMPTSKIVQFTIERSWCSAPQWQSNGSMQDEKARKGRRLYSICTGDDASFSLSIAAKEPSSKREVSSAVLTVLTKLVQNANQELITPGDKQARKFQGAVLY